jgi:hypothetical protein
MVLPPFGMAEDHPGGARVPQHRRGDIAGMGPLRRLMAVLATNRNRRAPQHLGDRGQMQSRGTDQQFACHALRPGGNIPSQCDGLLRKTVHLPVTGNQLWHCSVVPPYRSQQLTQPARRSNQEDDAP